MMSGYGSMLRALRGERTSRLPFAPRMDLWYIANRVRGTLPESLRGFDLPSLARALGIDAHAFKADLTLQRPDEDYALLGFGLENHVHFPFRFSWDDLDLQSAAADATITTVVRTPSGTLRTDMRLTEQMHRDGISMPFVTRYPLQSSKDIDPLCHFFEHLRVEANPDGFRRFSDHTGDAGLPIASGLPAASPMHLILHNLCQLDTFFYLYVDERKAMERLADAIDRVCRAILEAVLASDARVFCWGSNYDESITYPTFFAAEIQPWLAYACERAHAAGKLLLTHADGNNGALLDLFPAAGVDVLESVCTEPMIPITMGALRGRTTGRCALWGGIPSVVLLKESYDEAAFEQFLDRYFAQLGDGQGTVVGVSDNVPPDAPLHRVLRIRDRCRSFSPA